MPGSASILCTKCGAASATPLSTCAKCGGKNARVCGGCGFQNSLAKNYCDKCGNPIAELTPVAAPPPPPTAVGAEPKAEIPRTIVQRIFGKGKKKEEPKAKAPEKAAEKKKEEPKPAPAPAPSPAKAPPPPVPSPGILPPAKSKAFEPGASLGAPMTPAPLPSAGRQEPDPFAAPAVSGDLWAPPVAPVDDAPKAPSWLPALRRVLTAGFAAFAVSASVIGAWYFNENGKPENAVQRSAHAYLEALRRRDYPAAYAMFSDSSRKYCTLEEFVATRDSETWTWSNLRIDHQEPGAILLAYDLKIEGAEPKVDRVLFVEENRKWVRPYSWALMKKVEEAFDKNNADMGLVLAQAAATVNPRDPMARGYLCEAAYYRKSAADTERQCLAAIDLYRVYPSNMSLKSLYHLHAILADTYKNALQKPDQALDQFAQMLAFPNISPADQCEILLARAEAYITLSRPGEALADADRADQLCTRPQDHAYAEKIRRDLNAPNQ